MKTKIVLFVLVICTAMTNVFAKDATTTSELKKLLISRIEAFSRNDTVALNKICTKDYQLINPTGTKMSMKEVRKDIADQKKQIKSFVILIFQPFIAEDESIAFAISEIEEEILQDKAIIRSSLIVTEIYRKVNKSWKIQLTQIVLKTCISQ